MSRAVIFANGQLREAESVRKLIQEGDMLIAADGGTRHALLLGLVPSVIVGDLDSLGEIELRRLKDSGCRILQHPRDKNETDFELALHYVLEEGYKHILVIGALGGRLDQTLGNLSVMASPQFADVEIIADDGLERVMFTRRGLEIQGNPGDTISLLPWGGEVNGVTTTGLRWSLTNESLFVDKTRGISNELVGENGSLSITSGLLLVLQRRKQNLSL